MENSINNFLNRLNNISPIPKNELLKLQAISTIMQIKKGDYFLREGEKSSKIAFILDGLFRMTYLTQKGKEFTKSFLLENDFLVSYSAILEDRESYFSMEALEDSTIVVFDYKEWKILFDNHISWNKLLVNILEKAFCKKEKREREFLTLTSKERYESFLSSYPNLQERVKQHMIASYLGITPETLSTLKS